MEAIKTAKQERGIEMNVDDTIRAIKTWLDIEYPEHTWSVRPLLLTDNISIAWITAPFELGNNILNDKAVAIIDKIEAAWPDVKVQIGRYDRPFYVLEC